MSQEKVQPQDEPKKQDETTPDKESGATKAAAAAVSVEVNKVEAGAPPTTTTEPPQNNEELIIEQVRSELEQYFAPQNIQNDFNLRQKMTTDGYIDIDLLLDLKLMQDLVSNRDILIEAISRSKLLVMNTGCTMVKYMPLLERNVLILRDIATSTEKEEIMAIFENEHCAKPAEVHSDIGNNWFCQFKTEEECVKTAKYLQQFGTYHKERLHVRVKAIHDKNKADTSPQMAASPPIKPKIPPVPPQGILAPPYSPGYYQSAGYAYYDPNPNPLEAAYYYSPQSRPVAPPTATKTGKRKTKGRKTPPKTTGAKDVTPPPDATSADKEDPDRTAMSDYPSKFDKYPQEEFMEIYRNMKDEELCIPQSMRGRDFRIISEEVLVPIALQPKKADDKSKKAKDEEDSKQKQKQKKRKKRKEKKKEISGTYYEEDVYDEEYDDGYAYGDNASSYYYEDNHNARGAYYYNYEVQGGYGQREQQRQQTGGRSRGRARRQRQYQYYDDNQGYYESQRNERKERRGQKAGGQRYRARNRKKDEPKTSGARQYTSRRADRSTNQKKTSGAHWSPRQAKQYNTNKGVYRTKQTNASSSAY